MPHLPYSNIFQSERHKQVIDWRHFASGCRGCVGVDPLLLEMAKGYPQVRRTNPRLIIHGGPHPTLTGSGDMQSITIYTARRVCKHRDRIMRLRTQPRPSAGATSKTPASHENSECEILTDLRAVRDIYSHHAHDLMHRSVRDFYSHEAHDLPCGSGVDPAKVYVSQIEFAWSHPEMPSGSQILN